MDMDMDMDTVIDRDKDRDEKSKEHLSVKICTISSYSNAKNMPKISEVKLSICGVEVVDFRKNCDCGALFFKKLRNCDCGSASFKLRSCDCGLKKKVARAHLWLM
jgi:hypothetical protein